MFCYKCQANVSDDSLYCHQCGANLLHGIMSDTKDELTRNIKIDNFEIPEGEQFGDRYKIIEELGRGGMGRVYKAEDRVLGTVVALKMIRPEYLSDNGMIERFKKEILLSREITNENVVRIHDFGEEKGIKFITMNYIEGRSLKEIINDEAPLKFESVLSIVKDICKGLIAAHKKGIIHRDLKPHNIMIGTNDHVYLTDFGLAKYIEGTKVSQTGVAIGTPQYIAPEQWRSEDADKRSDIYTLGIVLYEMVTGKSLFTSDTDLGYLEKHLNEKPVIPQSIKDELPQYFRKIILKCLEKDRNLRFQSVEEVLNGLEEGIFVSTPILKRIKHLKLKQIKFSPVTIAVFLFIAVLLFKLFIPRTLQTGSVKKRSVAILNFKNMSGVKGLDHLSNSLSDLLITDLGQSKFIKVLPEAKLFKILNTTDYVNNYNLNSAIIEEINNKGNVNYLVHGSFIKSGELLRINIKLLDSETGELVDSSFADTELDKIFPAVDRLTRELKRSFKLTDNEIFEDIDINIENITTSSQEALKYYIEGKKLFNLEQYENSISALKKAVKIDPDFAMGYRKIAWAYAYLYDWDKRKEYFEETIKHTKNLSIREKFLVYADYYSEKEITRLKALEYYKKILDIYPDDIDVNYILGISNRNLENWDDAIKNQKIVLQNDRSNIKALNELVILYCSKQNYENAHEIINMFESEYPGLHKKDLLENKFLLYLIQGKTELASLIIDELNMISEIGNSDKRYFKGKIHFLNSSWGLVKNEYEYQLKIAGDNSFRIDYLEQKYLFLINGKLEKVLKYFESEISKIETEGGKISELSEVLDIFYRNNDKNNFFKFLNKIKLWISIDFPYYYVEQLYFHALGALLNNDLKKAEKSINHFINNKDKSIYSKDFERKKLFLLGELSKKTGDYAKSEKYFLKGISLLPGINSTIFHSNPQLKFYYFLADLYFKSEQFDLAEKWFKTVSTQTIGRYFYGDLFAKSFYYLGKIYQKKGWVGKAIESFEKFLILWQSGDNFYINKFISDTRNQLRKIK